MAKTKTIFVCTACGAQSPKWLGRCPGCDGWNTLQEETSRPAAPSAAATSAPAARPLRLHEIRGDELERVPLPMAEFSRVLGGGIVPGSLVLIGGDPGVGKSTLLMQVADQAARLVGDVLYVSGEESLSQIALRARRLGLDAPGLLLSSDSDLQNVLHQIEATAPRLVVIDSIQSVAAAELDSSPGSVSQLRECTLRFMQLAKSTATPIFLIGHVTKEGAIAGPKLLEHLVDTVLYLEGERFQAFRLLRCTKNRFGPTHEVGVFEMQSAGLVEVTNPSAAFLAERSEPAPGSVVIATLEGTRPILAEVQALANQTALAIPRRAANGLDYNRLLLLTAVLSRRLGVPLHDHDVYVNIVGGLRVDEPAADLGAALAILSSLRDRPVDPGLVAVGEVGLAGELRRVGQLELRLREAAKLGFERALVPKSALRALRDAPLAVVGAETLREAAGLALLA